MNELNQNPCCDDSLVFFSLRANGESLALLSGKIAKKPKTDDPLPNAKAKKKLFRGSLLARDKKIPAAAHINASHRP